ncbi:fused DSP-PTPase phosphatase/NAD kinase-like protein [Streptomyces pactum]|uniref:fused DSP-PTPase phosphatase/NAD kinase-like protein n=1 Tax=Streptomyces pactum TaxID=68249 RepID=UPI00370109FD
MPFRYGVFVPDSSGHPYMAVLPPPVRRTRRFPFASGVSSPTTRRSRLRLALRVIGICAIGYLLLWAVGALGILVASQWVRSETPPPAGATKITGIQHFQPVDAERHLWRGSAPSPAGYRALAEKNFSTVIDLRAEKLSVHQLTAPERAGLNVVRIPIRDGQTPKQGEVDRFVKAVRGADGSVFVHCGAGVGRTGTMAAAYTVRTGEDSGPDAVRRNLAVGPPSLEQIYYAYHLNGDDADQPPAAVRAVSRMVDAPRRLMSYF